MDLTIAILAGGASRRMGRDKASISVAGETMLERTARVARQTGLPALVAGRSEPEGWPHPDVPFYPDDHPGHGPLGGLAAALHAAGGSVILLPCDMPCLTAEALSWLVGLSFRSRSPHGLIVRNGGRPEPLFSFYSFSLLPLARDHLRRNVRAMHRLIASGEFDFADLPPEHAPALYNVNRPEEW